MMSTAKIAPGNLTEEPSLEVLESSFGKTVVGPETLAVTAAGCCCCSCFLT